MKTRARLKPGKSFTWLRGWFNYFEWGKIGEIGKFGMKGGDDRGTRCAIALGPFSPAGESFHRALIPVKRNRV